MNCFKINSESRLKSEDVGISYLEYCRDEQIHTHEYIEIVYIEEGAGEHIVDNTRIYVSKGSLIIMDRFCSHGYENIEHTKLFTLSLSPSFISDRLKKDSSMAMLFKLLGFKINEKFIHINLSDFGLDKQIEKLFFEILIEGVENKVGYLRIVHAKAEEILVTVGRTYTAHTYGNKKRDIIFDNAIEYITEHCCEHLQLEEVAAKFGYEPSYFSRMLKKYFGYSFKQLLIKKRLSRAVFYLWESDENIDEVIIKCGFTKKSFFYKAFEEQYGVKPKYLREYQKNFDNYLKILVDLKKSEKDTF